MAIDCVSLRKGPEGEPGSQRLGATADGAAVQRQDRLPGRVRQVNVMPCLPACGLPIEFVRQHYEAGKGQLPEVAVGREYITIEVELRGKGRRQLDRRGRDGAGRMQDQPLDHELPVG